MIHKNSACFGGNISPFCEQNDIATHRDSHAGDREPQFSGVQAVS
jgi:hypothetical protein